MESWKQRLLWKKTKRTRKSSARATNAKTSNIRVAARFKPRAKTKEEEIPENYPTTTCRKIVLPLHQRLAFIRMNRKLHSQKEALRVLHEQGDWFSDNQVVNGPETQPTQLLGGVKLLDCNNGKAFLVDRTKGLREFSFDNVMDGSCSQAACYQKVAMPLVADFLNGFNGTCLAYGQTGR